MTNQKYTYSYQQEAHNIAKTRGTQVIRTIIYALYEESKGVSFRFFSLNDSELESIFSFCVTSTIPVRAVLPHSTWVAIQWQVKSKTSDRGAFGQFLEISLRCWIQARIFTVGTSSVSQVHWRSKSQRRCFKIMNFSHVSQ